MALRSALVAPLILLAFTVPAPAQDATVFGDKLGTIPVSNANRAQVSGTGYVSGTLSGSTLEIEGTYEGLTAPASRVALFAGRLGEKGGEEVATLEPSGDTSGSFSGTVELSEDQLAILQASGMFVVVGTEPNPDGEVRAWLVAGNQPDDA
jgi:hypothetical protein